MKRRCTIRKPREQSGLEKSSRHCRAHRLNTLGGKIIFDIKTKKKRKDLWNNDLNIIFHRYHHRDIVGKKFLTNTSNQIIKFFLEFVLKKES